MKTIIKKLLFLVLFSLSCNSLPKITIQGNGEIPDGRLFADRAFINNKWLLTHSIELILPTGSRGYVIGISKLDGDKRRIETVMLSIEGLVLFQSVYEKSLKIIKAVPPMDSKEFGKGLINDIKLVFFPPEYDKFLSGRLSGGTAVYRYRGKEETTDILIDGNSVIKNRYDRQNRLKRKIVLKNIDNNGIAKIIEIKKPGLTGYSLNLMLLNFEKLK